MTEKKIRTRKAVIIGAGRVGSHSALCLMFQHLVNEIVFLDVNEEAARAQALDLEDLASGLGDNFVIRVGGYADCADAHFVILTAGRSRRPGETRLQMLDGTLKVLEGVVTPLRESGSAIVNGKGCTEFGIASVVAGIVAAILHNDHVVLPLSVHLDGEYGESGICAGVPCVLSNEGVESVLEIDLSYDERRAMRRTCEIIRDYVEKGMGPEEV